MSNIKLQTLLSEKFLKNTKRTKLTKQQKREMMEAISKFNEYGSRVYRADDLSELTQQLAHLIESANELAMNEAEGFDGITVNRHMKGLQQSYQLFEKTANEMVQLQQRLENLYEDIGGILSKYYDIADNGKMDNSSRLVKETWPEKEEEDDDVITIDPEKEEDEKIKTTPTKPRRTLNPDNPRENPDPRPLNESFKKRMKHLIVHNKK